MRLISFKSQRKKELKKQGCHKIYFFIQNNLISFGAVLQSLNLGISQLLANKKNAQTDRQTDVLQIKNNKKLIKRTDRQTDALQLTKNRLHIEEIIL
jgi:hypothetical protein